MTDSTPAPAVVATPSTKKLERVPKPDKTTLETEISKIQRSIEGKQNRINAIRSELDAIQNGRSGVSGQIKSAKEVFNSIREEKNKLLAERNGINAKLKSIQSKRDVHQANQKKLRAEIKYTSTDEIERQIVALRHKQETTSLSLAEEKKIIKEMESLAASRALVDKYAHEQVLVDRYRDQTKEIRSKQSEKNTEIDAVQEKMNAQKKIMDDLYSANNAVGEKDAYPKLIEERKAVKAEVDGFYNAIRALRAKFKSDNDDYYNYMRALREQKKEQQRAEEEAKKAEFEAKMAEYEKELAKIHPFQNEMDLCDALSTYVKCTYAKELSTDDKTSNEKVECKAVELDGMKAIVRVEEDFMMMGKGGKKNKKGGSKKNKAKKMALSFPIAQLESFSTIGLLPPTSVADLSATLESIKERKEHFSKQTEKPKTKESKKEETATPAKSSPKKTKKAQKFDADQSSFPTLGAGSDALAAPNSFSAWGPGSASSSSMPSAQDPVVGEA